MDIFSDQAYSGIFRYSKFEQFCMVNIFMRLKIDIFLYKFIAFFCARYIPLLKKCKKFTSTKKNDHIVSQTMYFSMFNTSTINLPF